MNKMKITKMELKLILQVYLALAPNKVIFVSLTYVSEVSGNSYVAGRRF